MTFKVAVCLSGQPRTWRESAPNILHHYTNNFKANEYDKEIQVDFFIHTWNRNTWKITGDEDRPRDLYEIEQIYKPKKLKIEHQDDWTENPWVGLFTSFNKSVFMKRQYELENNFEYDVVVKSRLDIIHHPNEIVHLPIIDAFHVYCTHRLGTITFENYQRNFNDTIFYCNSANMDLLTNAYKWHYTAKCDSKDVVDMTRRLGPGAILYKYMVNHGLYPMWGGHHDHCIMRDTAMHLDSIKQYDAINEIHHNLYK